MEYFFQAFESYGIGPVMIKKKKKINVHYFFLVALLI